MKVYVILTLIAFAACNRFFANKNFIKHLQKTASFKVKDPSENKFRDWTDEEIDALFIHDDKAEPKRKKLKTVEIPKRNLKHNKEGNPKNDVEFNWDVEFDWFKEHPECDFPVFDQGNCGASSVFATISSFQGRYCNHDGYQFTPMSVQDALSCNPEREGCKDGSPEVTINYLRNVGVVDADCFPFTSEDGSVEPCPTECKNGAEFKKYKVGGCNPVAEWIFSWLHMGVQSGPLIIYIDMYESMLHYEKGKYENDEGEYLGKASIMMYGTIRGDYYYLLLRNSWGTDWGMKGSIIYNFALGGPERTAYQCGW